MEKEFVPYELAVKLKELGFEFESLGGYVDKELFLWQDNDTTSFMHCEIEAPLWQQAFDWFRIKYEMYDCFDWCDGYYSYHIMTKGDFSTLYHQINLTGYYEFITYQEARQACLEKLIELVENK